MSRLASILASGLAFFTAAAAYAQPAMTPVTPVIVASPAPELPRWSIALRVSSFGIAPKDQDPNVEPDHYSGGGVELRYRLAPRWELGVLGQGGGQMLDDGSQGPGSFGMDLLTARVHLDPYARWDFYGTAGIGAAVMNVVGEAEQKPRGAGMLGFGVERRFGHIGVSAELDAFGMGPQKMDETTTQARTVTPPPASAPDNGFGGGSFTLAASYEF
ncbi:MAG TPA: hypothetical protein VL463_32905 [Kofleriaceae bacterium]|jgi:hypothetical protein|nr:hypothetical protein [Kofleriaceae bacterium]